MLSQRMRWELIIEDSLEELALFIKDSCWFGRENEIINLFAHRFLFARISREPLVDPTQIGIEVAVKQIKKRGGKKLVRKDLVLWNNPLETVWKLGAAQNSPAVILEWKTGNTGKCKADISWLESFTRIYPQVVGYSVCALMGEKRGIWYMKVVKGRAGKPRLIGELVK